MTRVYVAAGSNVDPLAHLRTALRELGKHFALQISPAYRNKAVGFEGDDFINLVVGFDTDDSIDQVLAHLHEAEAACGRPRETPKWEPRTMDLDLLLYGDAIRPDLRVPRADLLKRAYMLRPMAELAPQCVHPVARQTMLQLWNEFAQTPHAMQPVSLT